MTRSQGIIIGVLIGFVMLAFMGVIVALWVPYERLFPPTPTPTSPPPTITSTPTFPTFLPTASQETPPPAEPTATNTRVPTATPSPPRSPTPTVEIRLPTPRPTATPIPSPTPIPPPTNTATVVSPTPVPRQYDIYFEADETTITEGDCTDLEWRVTGATAVWLNGRSVPPSQVREVCPRDDVTYELTIELPGSARLEVRTVDISVEEEAEEEE